jgi:hypothetical protein
MDPSAVLVLNSLENGYPFAIMKVKELLETCDLIVLPTVAGRPHIGDVRLFAHRPTVFHFSLRDLARKSAWRLQHR